MDNYQQYVGKVLDKRYKILEAVGEGGMAFVLKAEDMLMNRIVALKILSSEFNGDEAMVKRFVDESKAVAMLAHKNIVSVYDVAFYSDMKYIVMEFLDGITLREYMDNKGVLSWKEACYYILQILKALEHAHSRGVIHRDIKPQNILLQKNGDIKVTDFGIAKIPGSQSVTVSEKAIGTVYYISPEQASGKATDFYSDLYSVGIMLYEACTGCLPFVNEQAVSVAMMQINAVPKPPIEVNPSIPLGLNQIILKAIEKKPADRFQSAHGMLKAIEVLYNNPDVVFTSGADNVSVGANTVNIDLIDTASIEGIDVGEYSIDAIEDEIAAPDEKKSEAPKKTGGTKKKKKDKASLFTKKSHSMFPIIVGVWIAAVIVIIAVGGFLFKSYLIPILLPDKDDYKTVTIPKLTEMEWTEELEQLLEDGYYGAKFKIPDENIEYKENPVVPKGFIISQSPAAGEEPMAGDGEFWDDIKIVISLGARQVIYEDQRGNSKTQAESWFESNDIVLTKPIYREDEVALNNQVIDVLDEGGNSIQPGDVLEAKSKVTLVISKISTDVVVPDLLGKTLTEAEAILVDEGFSLGNVSVKLSTEKDDLVIQQSLKMGETYTVGTPIDLVVSRSAAVVGDYLGKPLADAQTEIIRGGLICRTVEVESELEAGTVVEQSVVSGTLLERGSEITLTVAVPMSGSTEESDTSGIEGSEGEGSADESAVEESFADETSDWESSQTFSEDFAE